MLYEKSTNIGKDLETKITTFGKLSDQIDLLKSQLNELKSKYSTIEDELRPILNELQNTENKHLKTKDYLITIKRMGFDRTNVKYKTAFEKSLTKVNSQTRIVLQKILEETKSTSRVVSSIGVSKLRESTLGQIIKKMMSSFKKFINPLRKTNRSLDDLTKLSKMIIN